MLSDTLPGYYLDGEVLVGKWVPRCKDIVGDPIFQVVVPKTICDLVLKSAHASSGHFVVKKHIHDIDVSEDLKGIDPPKHLFNYVSDFRRRLYEFWEQANVKLGHSQDRMKQLFNRQAEVRVFLPGDQVLALVPVVGSPFQAKFVGPYMVLRHVSDLNYLTQTPEKRKRSHVCHVNLLKPYFVNDIVENPNSVLTVENPKGSRV